MPRFLRHRRPARALALLLTLAWVALPGCVSYRPKPFDEVGFQQRALRSEQDGVVVSAVALGRDEAKQAFGVPLASNGIQPLHLEIENGSDHAYAFFQQSIDPSYYSPREAAFKSHYSGTTRFLAWGVAGILIWPLWVLAPVQYVQSHVANRRMDEHFAEAGIGNRVLLPAERAEGFVFTHLDEGTKHVEVKLLNPTVPKTFDLSLPVPGVKADWARLEGRTLYPDRTLPDLDTAEILGVLEDLPCCVSNRDGAGQGDPLNLVVIGSFEDLLADLSRAGWDQTEIVDLSTSLRTASSFLLGSRYRYSPVSNLYLYGRAQDVAFQKARETIHERNHLRLWVAPFTFRGLPVWVGQVSRDIGVKFTTRAWNLTTHVIDPDIDDSRENVMGDLLETGRVAAMAYVSGVPPSLRESPARNLMGDPYWTDGFRAAVLLAGEPTELRIFGWEVLRQPTELERFEETREER